MNGKKDKMQAECLYPGDARVVTLLGKQKLSKEEHIRKSYFVFSMYIEGRYLLFHTMTRQVLLMPPEFIDFFTDGQLFSASVLEEDVPAKLYESHFLVPENEQESQTYLELKDLLVLKEELPCSIIQYVILPTTACNARCFYCFEQGMKYQKMSSETVEDTLHFILNHRPKDNKRIHIHWFGGEPMCASENIDRICSGLLKEGIDFSAEMTSNGSLFTEELTRKAAEKWKISEIQITLDGMAEEYAKRKRYISMEKPFETVIRNIHLLIAAGIKITVRLNVDEKNLGEIYRTVDYLKQEFSKEEQRKMHVYAHSLFGQPGEESCCCPIEAGSSALEEYVLNINDYIYRQGLMVRDLGNLFTLKSQYCMVTAPECNVVIDSVGRLFACEAMTGDMQYGDVKTGFDRDAWNRVTAPCSIRSECERCVFLPQCTEFDRCPNHPVYDDCYMQEKHKLEQDLRFLYVAYKEQVEKERQGQESQEHMQQDSELKEKPAKDYQDQLYQEQYDTNGTERKETRHVSD